MPHDSRAIANYFLKKADAAGRELTPMQVIKLVYFAHGWTLALADDPLIADEVEAWDYGPVVRCVYDAFKHYGNQPIRQLATEHHMLTTILGGKPVMADLAPLERAIADKVWETYGGLKGFQLSGLTHQTGSPWDTIYHQHGRNAVIPNDLIAQHFKELATRNAERRKQAATA